MVGLGWRRDEAGAWIALRITDEGMHAIGIGQNEADTAPNAAADDAVGHGPATQDEAAQAAPSAPARATLRNAASALLAAWDAGPAQDTTGNAISRSVEALRGVLAGEPAHTPRDVIAPRKPRMGTKQGTELALLRRPEGTTVAQVMEATGWAPHTVRGFFAGLRKRHGIEVTVLERVRQVGPNKTGAKGSYSVYQIAVAVA